MDTAKFIASVTENISEAPPEPEPSKHDPKWGPAEGFDSEHEKFKRLGDRMMGRRGKPESDEEKIRRLQRDSDELSWIKNPDRNGG